MLCVGVGVCVGGGEGGGLSQPEQLCSAYMYIVGTLTQPSGVSKGVSVEFQLCTPMETQW
jgi:hypothetical protein